MNRKLENISKEMFKRANSSKLQEFGSFFLSRMMGLEIEVKPDLCIVKFQSEPTFFNPQGTLHGGVISTVMDISMGHLLQKDQKNGTTIELNIKFLLPIKNEKTICEGSYIKKGRSISVMQSNLYREDKKLAAHATSTWKIFEH